MSGYVRTALERTNRQFPTVHLRTLTAQSPGVLRRARWSRYGVPLSMGRALDRSSAIEWVSFAIWVPFETKSDFPRCQLLWRHLSGCRHRFVYEISGNAKKIRIVLRCHRADAMIVRHAFAAVFPKFQLVHDDDNWWRNRTFTNYVEIGGTGREIERLTLPDTLPESPLWAFVDELCSLPDDTEGFYQCVVEPTGGHDEWHQFTRLIHTMDYLAQLEPPQWALQRLPQQTPANDLHNKSDELTRKANNDSAFAGILIRLGTVSASEPVELTASFLAPIRAAGRALPAERVAAPPRRYHDAFFRAGLSRRSGLILNADELASLATILGTREQVQQRTQWPAFHEETADLTGVIGGTVLGQANLFGESINVGIPDQVLDRSLLITGATGSGKSFLQLLMAGQLAKTRGFVVIDPHGDLVRNIANRLDGECRARCICLDLGDPRWIPQWNVLEVGPGMDIYRLADDHVDVLRRNSDDWGARLEMMLRFGLIGLLHIPGSTYFDLFQVTRQKSEIGEVLRKQIIANCPDPIVRDFWAVEFKKSYSDKEIAASRHKLQRIVVGGSISQMFACRDSRLRLRDVMNEKKILLLDLSRLGGGTRNIAGSLILNLVLNEALARAEVAPDQRVPFSIFVDEAHQFAGGKTIDDLYTQIRKFKVSAVLSHQFLNQFDDTQNDALLSAGGTIIGRVNHRDATILAKGLQGKVSAEELTRLPDLAMVARIGTQIVRFKLPEFTKPTDPNGYSTVLEASRRAYCIPVAQVGKQSRTPAEPLFNAEGDYSYDEEF